MPKKIVMIGFIGTQLDNGHTPDRWNKWRPTISMAQHDDVLIHRFDLLHTAGRHDKLAAQVCTDLSLISPSSDIQTHTLAIDDPWDFEQVYASLLDFARSYPFNTEEEEYWIHITTGTHVAQICLFLLAEAHYLPAKLLQTSPPRRMQGEAIGSYSLIDLDLSRYNQIAARFKQEQVEHQALLKAGIATRNPQFNQLIDELERIAVRSRAPILLMGPTGAGKSFLARRIYTLKKQTHQIKGRFVEVNCATLTGDGAGSTLFGHTKGAFTGAQTERAGLLKSADGGLLFLDEIGELGLDEQAMLLKAIEEKVFFPVGSDKEQHSDFQLIAGTNRDLREEVAKGRFREDLFARINLWSYHLPSLKQRKEDIAPNIDFELARISQEQGEMLRFNQDAKHLYLQFAQSPRALWQGNFRDLSASITRMATLSEAGRITPAVVNEEIKRLEQRWQIATRPDSLDALLSAEVLANIDPFDRVQLAYVVQVCTQSQNVAEAGKQLFAQSRQQKKTHNDSDRLSKYLNKYGLEFKQLQSKG